MNRLSLLILVSALVLSGGARAEEKPADEQTHEQTVDKPGTLTIAACQFPVSASLAANGDWVRRQMREAKEEGADLAHFCECALSGYPGCDYQTLDGFDWEQLAKETDSILELAKELELWVILGSMHRLTDDHKPHNCLYVISDEGRIIDRYDKRFCTPIDLKYFSPGNHFATFEVNGVTCGLLICYDIRFPELYRQYHKLGARVIFHSYYNARQREGSIHPIIMPITSQARAATNNMFVSLTNSSAPRSWPCHLITPDGLIANQLPVDKPGILVNTIDTTKDYYDASRHYRLDAIDGKLNSGEVVDDPRSKDRTSH